MLVYSTTPEGDAFQRCTNSRLHNNNYPWVYAIILRERLLSIAVRLANGHRLEPDAMGINYRNTITRDAKQVGQLGINQNQAVRAVWVL